MNSLKHLLYHHMLKTFFWVFCNWPFIGGVEQLTGLTSSEICRQEKKLDFLVFNRYLHVLNMDCRKNGVWENSKVEGIKL